MVSPLEIQKGSLLLHEGRVKKVKAIGDFILFEGTKEWIGGSLVNGEPLTATWLERFGFDKEEFCFTKGKLSIVLASPEYYPNGRIYFNSWAIKEHQPEYVHQLQMLYFSLFLEHLTIPKLPK